MVGEIRDGETASLAINAALTGHLVLSTIHTNSAAGAIPRLMEMGIEPFLLVSTLRVVVGQRLVRKLCDKREEYHLTEDMLAGVASEDRFAAVLKALKEEKLTKAKSIPELTFGRPIPSAECEDGYSGRVGIHEVLAVNPSIRELVMQQATGDVVEAQARKEGMLTLFEDGIYKAARGITSLEEVLRAVSD
jgi:type II secretory ATPase GspE/PulE/Tfp pilus assembly ATPase PilB-like protein